MDHTGEIPGSGHPVASLPSNGVQNSCRIHVNGFQVDAIDGEQLIDAINRSGIKVPHVCYHKSLSARPSTSSLARPKLIPASTACWMNGRLSSSSSTQSRHFFEP